MWSRRGSVYNFVWSWKRRVCNFLTVGLGSKAQNSFEVDVSANAPWAWGTYFLCLCERLNPFKVRNTIQWLYLIKLNIGLCYHDNDTLWSNLGVSAGHRDIPWSPPMYSLLTGSSSRPRTTAVLFIRHVSTIIMTVTDPPWWHTAAGVGTLE